MVIKKYKNVIGFILLIIIITGINYMVTNYQYKKQYAWINLNKVYNDFSLKKDLEGKLHKVENERKKITDSLELHLKISIKQFELLNDAEKDLKAPIFQLKKQEYLLKKQEFDEDNTQLQNEYQQQVLTQINQYVKEYAINEHYSMIFGAEGTGTLMFADEKIEITNEILEYINAKYKGE